MAKASWFPDLYYPVPIIYENTVFNNELFFVIEHNNQHGLLYGKHQNTLPIRFGFYQTHLNKISNENINLGQIICSKASFIPTNAQIKIREEFDSNPYIKIKNIFSINDGFSCEAETNSVNTFFGDFIGVKYYNISSTSNTKISMYQYSEQARDTDKIVLVSGNTTNDNQNFSLDNRDVKLHFKAEIQFSNSKFRVPDKIIDVSIGLDLPRPRCSIIPFFDTNGSFNFRMFSTIPCHRMTYSREENGVNYGWISYESETTPFCTHSFATAEATITRSYKLLYDCYDYNTGFKAVTQAFESNYVYTDPHIYGLSTTNPNSIIIGWGDDSNDYSQDDIYARIYKEQDNIKISNDYQNNTYAKNPIFVSDLEVSDSIDYSVTVVDKRLNHEFIDPNIYKFDVRKVLPKNKIIYYNAITDIIKNSTRTTAQLCSVDRNVYIVNNNNSKDIISDERGYTQEWAYKINSLSYGGYDYTKPQNPWWLNTSSDVTIRNKRITEYPVDFNNFIVAETFVIENRQPWLDIVSVECIGASIKCIAKTSYRTENSTLSIACNNWQCALVKYNDYKDLKCLRQAVYNSNGNISNYYSLYTNKDLNWVDIENSNGKSEIEFNLNAPEVNVEYYILVRAKTAVTNIPTNNLNQFNSDLTPKYKIKTTGGVPIYADNSWKIGLPYIRIVPDKNIPGNEDKDPYWAPATAYIYTKSNNKWSPIIWDGTTPPAEEISVDTPPQTLILDDSSEGAAKDAYSASADTFVNIGSISDVYSKEVKSIESENSVDIITQTIAFSRLKAGIESSINIPMVSTADIYSRAVKEVTYKTELILSYTIESKSADAKQLVQAEDSKTLELFDTASASSAATEHSESTGNSIYTDDTAEGTNCDGNHLTSDVDTNILSDSEPITISDLTYTSGNIDIPIETNTDIIADDSSQADSSDIFDIDAKCEVMVIQGGYLAPEIDGNDLKIKSVMTTSQEDDILTLE